MKKTYTINIAGSIFHIDDDAFEKLQRYLRLLNDHFSHVKAGQEILQDIEARCAELLSEKTANKIEVVTNEMVDELIARMGKPEDFVETEDEEGANDQTESSAFPDGAPIRRRLYRDGDHRVLGGVCSGLGAYFNVSVIALRLIFLVLFFAGAGSPFLIYIILWIVVPKAKTTIQRLEMRGKEANVSNIEKSIKEEVSEIGENYKRFKNSPAYEKGMSRMDRFGDVVGSILRVVLRVIVLIFGAILILGGIALLIMFVATFTLGYSMFDVNSFGHSWDSNFDLAGLLSNFVDPGSYAISLIALTLLIGIPVLSIIYMGTKLIFNYNTNNRAIGLGAFGTWMAALIVLIVVSVGQVKNFAKETNQTITQKIECTQCKTLYLEMADDLYETMIDNDVSLNNMKVATVKGKQILLGQPEFTIEKSQTDEFLLQIKKHSNGLNSAEAQKNVEDIEYSYNLKDSTLTFDPYFFLKEDAKWRNQEIKMILKVPEGKAVYLNEKLISIIYDIENIENMWDNDMVGKFWIMTPEGLTQKK
jgi:phage shock protein PspC (stress-responsive transcriptional regulator)